MLELFICKNTVKQENANIYMSKFLMRYQQFAYHAYCGAAGPVSKMASQQKKAFCVLRFEVTTTFSLGHPVRRI
jgi:hypothetical protein